MASRPGSMHLVRLEKFEIFSNTKETIQKISNFSKKRCYFPKNLKYPKFKDYIRNHIKYTKNLSEPFVCCLLIFPDIFHKKMTTVNENQFPTVSNPAPP